MRLLKKLRRWIWGHAFVCFWEHDFVCVRTQYVISDNDHVVLFYECNRCGEEHRHRLDIDSNSEGLV